jgi:signal transduction histidine kinase
VGQMELRPTTFVVWRTFTLAAVLGYLLVTPTAVLLAREADRLRPASLPSWLGAGLLTLSMALACGLVYTWPVTREATWAVLTMSLPLLLLLSAVRFGALGASASLLLVTVIWTWASGHGLGPFRSQSPAENTLSLQLFMLGIGVPLLGLAVVLGEQRRAIAAVRSSQSRLTEVTHELIAAREDEATRIGRELHDDVGQRIALVSIGLSRLRKALAGPAPSAVLDVTRLQEQASAINRSLREISHELHPAALEQVGLSRALRLKCDEVHQATGMDLRMVNHGDMSVIPRDVALCLFRVAQEALNNVTRHSGAHRVDLSLQREDTEILLEVTDDGRGFAPGAPGHIAGLGLYSVAERVDSVGGTLTVASTPGAGTTLRVAIPFGGSSGA